MIITEFISTGPLPAPAPEPETAMIRAGYEAAGLDQRRLWPHADTLSPDALADPFMRATLRSRCRTELENNPFLSGAVATWAADLIGTGPTLQILLDDDVEAADLLEDLWEEWARGVELAETLRVLCREQPSAGESFVLKAYNPELDSPVKLHPRLVECDRITTPSKHAFEDNEVDGIRFDPFGNPETYFVLKQHPGDVHRFVRGTGLEFDEVPASELLHYFEPLRPQQHRGIPRLAPSLMMAALHRRYVLATVQAAETAADIAGIIRTQQPPPIGTKPITIPYGTVVPMERGTLFTMPGGYSMEQLKAEQPTTTFPDARKAFVSDIIRPLSMPLTVAIADASGANYSSARMDRQVYNKSLSVERDRIAAKVLDKLFRSWLEEAILVLPEPIRQRLEQLPRIRRAWYWPGFEHVDPTKEAEAQAKRLEMGTTTLQDEMAREGKDWDKVTRQWVKERSRKAQLEAEAQKAIAGDDAVQDTALNGAQISSLQEILMAAARKELPLDSVRAMILGSFPALPRALVEQIVKPLESFEAPKPETAHVAADPEADPEGGDDES